MKAVINQRFGGFGLSNVARIAPHLRDCKSLERSTFDEYFGENPPSYVLRAVENSPNLPKSIDPPQRFRCGYGTLYDVVGRMVYHYPRAAQYRTDPDLIEVVGVLGEEADGKYARLKIVEVDEGFRITEYDGKERVTYTCECGVVCCCV